MSESTPIESLVDGILEGRAAERVRSAAARGALPLPRTTLVRVQVALLRDEDETIRSAAEMSLKALETAELKEVLADRTCAAEVLAHFAKQAARDESLAESITFHADTPVAAIAVLAASGNAAVIELVLTNQELLLARPALLERLMVNPALRADQRGRLLELLERASKQADAAAAAAGNETLEASEENDDFEEAAHLLDVDVGDLLSASEIMGGDEFERSEDETLRDAYKRIVSLNAAQKAILAMKGGREERMILIRDTNKVVSLGVLKNPRINDHDVDLIAKMRNVSDEVLRHIARNRDWAKSYSIVHSLVTNPRTPQSVSSNFIPRLTNRDLKELSRSRDVPELIRRMAKRTHATRTQKREGAFRKK